MRSCFVLAGFCATLALSSPTLAQQPAGGSGPARGIAIQPGGVVPTGDDRGAAADVSGTRRRAGHSRGKPDSIGIGSVRWCSMRSSISRVLEWCC